MSIESNEQQPEIFDSLPYYDNDLDLNPALKQKVEAELARENRQNPQTLHPKVPPPIDLFTNNPLLRAELQRVESHQPMPPLDTIRHQVPAPISSSATVEDWQAALNNAKAQLEHQRIRQSNIALLQTYGSNAWRVQNYLMEHTTKGIEKALEEVRERTTEVNRERKQNQTKLGAQLTSLETRWTELISNVLQIELANVALEAEVNELAKRETELAAL
ncbi:breast carcinoma amplified sequence 2 [Pyrrhoderma noxium]|uniref:Breast carcinoma amplified sequence 2 n=1 Tax=Pyrrhoderma noxium TaxID=2282107 RepID=A0A286UQM8_9AGAM|nr:breast carcinoma amplified sequence 2 [Pyrrhoderma noxium]